MNINIPQLSFSRFTVVLYVLLNASVALADEATAFAAFDEMNTFDIEIAQIAVKEGQSQGVKALGQMIVDDHSPIQQEARRIAAQYGLKPAAARSNPEYVKIMESLNSASGPAFDKAYVMHELPFSKDFIRKLKEEIVPAITHEDLKIYLQGLSLKFEEHLMHIKHIAMQLEMETHGMDHKTMHEKK